MEDDVEKDDNKLFLLELSLRYNRNNFVLKYAYIFVSVKDNKKIRKADIMYLPYPTVQAEAAPFAPAA